MNGTSDFPAQEAWADNITSSRSVGGAMPAVCARAQMIGDCHVCVRQDSSIKGALRVQVLVGVNEKGTTENKQVNNCILDLFRFLMFQNLIMIMEIGNRK